MILSSADILRILGRNEVIRLSAQVSIVDSKPALSGREGIHIYINRFPVLEEFEATWRIWIESDEEDDLIIAELQRLLPRVQVVRGLMTTVSTTEFRSGNTQRAPEAPRPAQAQVDLSAFEDRFQALVEDVQDQMLLVTSGRNGQDGKDGRDGVDGRDGRDLVATEASLEDLQNVEQNIAKEDGQVLTWKDGVWQNLFIPQIVSSISGGGGGGGTTINKLDDIGDVDVPAPGDNYVLAFNAATGNWEAAAAPPADISGNSIDDLADVDTSTAVPLTDQALVWDGTNWVPADHVQSVGGKTGAVTLEKADITDFSDADYATAAQGALADTAVQPGDNISVLTNDAGYITDPGVTQILAGTNVTLDPAQGTGAVTINASGIQEAPTDGNYYVRASGVWVKLTDALASLGVVFSEPIDGGNFITGEGTAITNRVYDGGNFTDGSSAAPDNTVIDGGLTTP